MAEGAGEELIVPNLNLDNNFISPPEGGEILKFESTSLVKQNHEIWKWLIDFMSLFLYACFSWQ
jgi:hypothetical protein